MQPCSQPRYGFRLAENPTSGLSLVRDDDARRVAEVLGPLDAVPFGIVDVAIVRSLLDPQAIEPVGRLQPCAPAWRGLGRGFGTPAGDGHRHAAILPQEGEEKANHVAGRQCAGSRAWPTWAVAASPVNAELGLTSGARQPGVTSVSREAYTGPLHFATANGDAMTRLIQCVVWLVICLAAAPARAQFETGAVLGTVRDNSGAVVPGATVTLLNTQTGVAVVRTTDAEGGYEFFTVRPGVYKVTAELSGFATAFADNVQVSVGGRQRVELTMKVG